LDGSYIQAQIRKLDKISHAVGWLLISKSNVYFYIFGPVNGTCSARHFRVILRGRFILFKGGIEKSDPAVMVRYNVRNNSLAIYLPVRGFIILKKDENRLPRRVFPPLSQLIIPFITSFWSLSENLMYANRFLVLFTTRIDTYSSRNKIRIKTVLILRTQNGATPAPPGPAARAAADGVSRATSGKQLGQNLMKAVI